MEHLTISFYGLAFFALCAVAIACITLWQWVFEQTPNITLEMRHKIRDRKIKKVGRVFLEVFVGLLFIGAILYQVLR